MHWKRNTVACLAIAAFSLSPISVHASDYDMGGGDGFFDEGAGFENGFTGPGQFKLVFGVLLSIALVAGAIAVANNPTADGAHSGP